MRGATHGATGPEGRGFRRLAGDAEARFLCRLPPFRPRFPWYGGDLQTVRNSLVPSTAPGGGRLLRVPLRDRAAGTLLAAVSRPQRVRRRAIMLLVHGLGGCAESAYMRRAAGALHADGHLVLRLNLRGADPAGESLGPYHAGLTDDLEDTLAEIARAWPGRPVIAVGFSLGGHLLLRLAATPGLPGDLTGVVSISAPLDLASTVRQMARPRNRIYERRLVAWLRRQRLRPGSAPRRALARLADFDRHVVVPAHGFRDLGEYYTSQSAIRTLSGIRLPTLAIHADNDPWIPASDYLRAAWPDGAPVWVLLTRGGGHVGFHGADPAAPWYVAALRGFRDHLALRG